MELHVNKKKLAYYLEETAYELRGMRLTQEYVDDVCGSLKDAIKSFHKAASEDLKAANGGD